MRILGIETSCDNTAFAVFDTNLQKFLISHNLSQASYIASYGYIPTELSRLHACAMGIIFEDDNLIRCISTVDYVAVTAGPGLIMSLYVGVSVAKFISLFLNKKIFFVDHIEAHMLSCKLDNIILGRFLSIVLSGGHCIFSIVSSVGCYKAVAYSIDDAPGEVFDKIARALGLEQPDGLGLEVCAKSGAIIGDLVNINVNIKRSSSGIYELSFSGIKSHFIRKINENKYKSSDIACSFQYLIFSYVIKVIKLIYKEVGDITICFSGGVCCNEYFRNMANSLLSKINLIFATAKLCGDNAEMVCWAAAEYYKCNGVMCDRTFLCDDKVPYDKLDYDKIR